MTLRLRSEQVPPRVPEWLLSFAVRDAEWRDSIVGDLREEFAGLVASRGRRMARGWYWRQAIAIGSRTTASRLGLRRLPRGSWLSAADLDMRAAWHVGFTRDLQHAYRALLRRPGTSAVIVVTLALALAANSTVFSFIDAMALRPFRLPGIERVVLVSSTSTRPQDVLAGRWSVAPADFQDWRREAGSISALTAIEWWDANLSGIDVPEQVPGFRVTADFFSALAVRPALGRTFRADDEQPGQHRVVLGHGLWVRRFGADPAIVGKMIRLDGEPHEVIGVAPRAFALPFGAELWAAISYTDEEWADRRRGLLLVVGRLAPGVTVPQARAEMAAIAEWQRRDHPDTNASRPNAVVDFTSGMSDPGTATFLAIWQAAGALLLLIACANIANLLLARGAERQQELAIRLALGAGRRRLAVQTMLEGAVLAGAAVVLSIPIAWAGIGLGRAGIPPAVIRYVPGYAYLDLNWAVLLATAALGALAVVLFSAVPALQAARGATETLLRQHARALTASRERLWMRTALATIQVGVTLALLFGSHLMWAAADRAANGPLGFDKSNVLVARLTLPERPYADAEKRRQFAGVVQERLQRIPAVTAVGMTSILPYGSSNNFRDFWPQGAVLQRHEVRRVDYRRISGEYFDVMRIPLLAGRRFSDDDRRDTEAVAIVSRSLADRYWPDQDALGRRFKVAEDGEWIVIVGIVGDVLHDWFMQQRAPTVYRPLSQDAPYAQVFVARTIGEPTAVAGELRRSVAAADPDQPILDLKSLAALIDDRTAGLTFLAVVLGTVAFIASGLAVTGLYSVMAYLASRRTQEFGVRIALGATSRQVIRLAVAQAFWITLVGIGIGVALAAGVGRAMESTMFGAVADSPAELGVMAGLLAAVVLVAAYLPARRAATIDPAMALRTE